MTGVQTCALPICFRDAEKFQQTDHVVGIPRDGERTLRNVGRSAIALQVDGNDHMAFDQSRKRFHPGKSERGRDEYEWVAASLDLVVHLQAVDRKSTRLNSSH